MLGLAHFSLEECGDMYRRFGSEVFRQNPLVGTVQMGWSHSYYKTETWETILQYVLKEYLLFTNHIYNKNNEIIIKNLLLLYPVQREAGKSASN